MKEAMNCIHYKCSCIYGRENYIQNKIYVYELLAPNCLIFIEDPLEKRFCWLAVLILFSFQFYLQKEKRQKQGKTLYTCILKYSL